MDASVVIPCYKVSEHLEAACSSLKAQSFAGSWEAIFVDDGDPEGNAYLDHADVGRGVKRVLHQENRGLSAARNAGLAVATGRIVLFMDPDDVVEADWMARLVNGMDGVDLAWGGFSVTCDGHTWPHASPDIGQVYLGGEAVKRRVWRAVFGYRLRDILRHLTPRRLWNGCGREFVGLWSRAYSREVLGDLRFDETLGLYEDAMFVAAYALRAKSMRVIGETGYRYAIRPGGLMMRETREKKVLHKFELRDARRRLDPKMTSWRGTWLTSAMEIARDAGVGAAFRYLLWLPPPSR